MVSPSTVRRVLHAADLRFRALPRPGRSKKRPFPEWAQYTPNSIWIFDTTHFTAAGMSVLIIEDLVSRKWITEVVSVEETSTQVELGFTHALQTEGLLEAVDARHDDGRVDIGTDDQARPILLAVSDNGPQMTSGSTREFMAPCAIAQHFGRPGTPPTRPGSSRSTAPSRLRTRTCWPSKTRPRYAELAVTRQHYNTVRLHAGIGYVTPTTNTKAAARRSARPAKPAWNKPDYDALQPTAPNETIRTARDPTMLFDSPRISIAKSDTPHSCEDLTTSTPSRACTICWFSSVPMTSINQGLSPGWWVGHPRTARSRNA